MDNLLSITLEAHHAIHNHHRWYQITVGRDLLDDWSVCIRYGRTGQGGQERRFGGSNIDSMRRIVREHLRRRESAPRRIGCLYRLVHLSFANEMEPSAWIPAKWMAVETSLANANL